MESFWDWVRLEFDGGPWDGATLQWPGHRIWPGVVHDFVADDVYLYRSNGPIDRLENVVQMTYVGKRILTDIRAVLLIPPKPTTSYPSGAEHE
jgi:hypothetical protein